MKGKLGIVLLALILLVTTYLFFSYREGVDQTYLLPNGFEGCVTIFYDVKNAPPLEIVDNEIVYNVPNNGIIYTSSPMEFGWVNKEHSGPHQVKAFYVDEEGNRITELSQENLRFGATGSYQEEGKSEQRYFYQIFGSEEVEANGCPQVDFWG